MTSTSGGTARRYRPWRVLLALAIGFALSLVAGELAVRTLLFGRIPLARSLGARLRKPALFCDGNSEDDFWKLEYLLSAPEELHPAPHPDAHLGWTGENVMPGTYENADEARLAGRTPILLYGDSFAQCTTASEECFQGLLERSDLAASHCLLNYGVSGYGLDQTYLMLARSIDRFADQRPIVIVSLLVDSDLDRCMLAFRGWPKPRLDVVGDELSSREPETLDPERYLALHPLSIRSYLVRLLASDGSPLPRAARDWVRGDHRRIAEKQRINRRILIEIDRLLRARGLTCTIFLFHSEKFLGAQVEATEWQEPFVRAVAGELGIPVISARPYLFAAARKLGTDPSRFYGHAGASSGHHNPAGNAVVFEALRPIIRGSGGAIETESLERWIDSGALRAIEAGPRTLRVMGRTARVFDAGGELCARVELSIDPSSGSTERVPCLFVRGGAVPTEVRIKLDRGLARWRASVSVLARPGAACAGREIELEVRADGATIGRARLKAGAPPEVLELGIAGKRELSIVADARGAEPECAWIRVAEPRLQ
jgi:hypothetical protein